MAKKEKVRMGRPPKHEGERLSKNRTFRVRPALDAQLMAAAEKSGRSVSEEIEYRLEESFRRHDQADLVTTAARQSAAATAVAMRSRTIDAKKVVQTKDLVLAVEEVLRELEKRGDKS